MLGFVIVDIFETLLYNLLKHLVPLSFNTQAKYTLCIAAFACALIEHIADFFVPHSQVIYGQKVAFLMIGGK